MRADVAPAFLVPVHGEHLEREDVPRPARHDARVGDSGLLLQFAQRHPLQVTLSVGVPADPAPRSVRVVEHHERLGDGRIDRPDRARHMRERVAVEHVRVGFQLLEDNLAIGCLLLVEGLVGAYVGGEGHGEYCTTRLFFEHASCTCFLD